jgi:hypothetical protein
VFCPIVLHHPYGTSSTISELTYQLPQSTIILLHSGRALISSQLLLDDPSPAWPPADETHRQELESQRLCVSCPSSPIDSGPRQNILNRQLSHRSLSYFALSTSTSQCTRLALLQQDIVRPKTGAWPLAIHKQSTAPNPHSLRLQPQYPPLKHQAKGPRNLKGRWESTDRRLSQVWGEGLET